MKTSGGRVAAPASYHKLGAGIDTKVQRAGLFVGYLYSAQKLGWFFCSNEQLRLISTMISGHEFWLLQGGCVAGETWRHSSTSFFDRSAPTACMQGIVFWSPLAAAAGGAIPKAFDT
jgi:hypothetical protein